MARRQHRTGAAEASDPTRAAKSCAACGRRIEWRAKWARDWEHVRYCSDACRARGVRAVDRELEQAIITLQNPLDDTAALVAQLPDGHLGHVSQRITP